MIASAAVGCKPSWHNAENTDVPTLAAASGMGLVKNHPYRDGNKRIGVLAMLTFLEMNGHEFDARSTRRAA